MPQLFDSLGHQVRAKTSLMTAYCQQHKADVVPDPYYGGPAGFEKVRGCGRVRQGGVETPVVLQACDTLCLNQVLDLLEDASQGLLQHIQQEEAVA